MQYIQGKKTLFSFRYVLLLFAILWSSPSRSQKVFFLRPVIFLILKLLQLTCILIFQEMWRTLVKLLVISFSTKFNPVGKNISVKLQVNFVNNPVPISK